MPSQNLVSFGEKLLRCFCPLNEYLLSRGAVCQVTSVVSDSLQPHGHEPTRLLCPWDSPGKNTGMGCHVLLQGILPDLGMNPHLLFLSVLAGRFFTTSATWEAPQENTWPISKQVSPDSYSLHTGHKSRHRFTITKSFFPLSLAKNFSKGRWMASKE